MYNNMKFKIIDILDNITLQKKEDEFHSSMISREIIVDLLEEDLPMYLSFVHIEKYIKTTKVEKIIAENNIVTIKTKNSSYIY